VACFLGRLLRDTTENIKAEDLRALFPKETRQWSTKLGKEQLSVSEPALAAE